MSPIFQSRKLRFRAVMWLAGASQRRELSIWVPREGLLAKVTVKPSVGAE